MKINSRIVAIALSAVSLTAPIVAPILSSPAIVQAAEYKKEMNIGDTIELKDAKTANKNIVSIENGTVTAKKMGFAVINYTNENERRDRMIIYVRPSLSFFRNEQTIRVGQ